MIDSCGTVHSLPLFNLHSDFKLSPFSGKQNLTRGKPGMLSYNKVKN